MKIISMKLLKITSSVEAIGSVVSAAKTCYQSIDRPLKPSDVAFSSENLDFIRRLIQRDHGAMLEFTDVVFRAVIDRGISHELVRHRIASYAQESTRYCDYGKEGINFVRPYGLNDRGWKAWIARVLWYVGRKLDEWEYKLYRKLGKAPQFARCALPTCVKTEIVFQMNMREFRHFIKLRAAPTAHPDMRKFARMCLSAALEASNIRVFVEDLEDLLYDTRGKSKSESK